MFFVKSEESFSWICSSLCFVTLGSRRADSPPCNECMKFVPSVKPKGLNSEPFLYRKAWESSQTSCVISPNQNKHVSIKCFRKTVLCVSSYVKTVVVCNAANQAFQNDVNSKFIHEKGMLAANLFKSRVNAKH